MIIGILFLIAVLVAITQSFSDEEQPVFIGTMSHDFEVAGNWSIRRVPVENDSIFMTQHSPDLTINKDVTVNNFNTLWFKGRITLNAILTIKGKLDFYTGSQAYTHGTIPSN
jgi:hypothetical protein